MSDREYEYEEGGGVFADAVESPVTESVQRQPDYLTQMQNRITELRQQVDAGRAAEPILLWMEEVVAKHPDARARAKPTFTSVNGNKGKSRGRPAGSKNKAKVTAETE